MPKTTIYKMPNASGCYPVAKSHQAHQGSESELLQTFISNVFKRNFCLQQQTPAYSLTHGCVTMLSNNQGCKCKRSYFALIL